MSEVKGVPRGFLMANDLRDQTVSEYDPHGGITTC
jgi:hypothetical protein